MSLSIFTKISRVRKFQSSASTAIEHASGFLLKQSRLKIHSERTVQRLPWPKFSKKKKKEETVTKYTYSGSPLQHGTAMSVCVRRGIPIRCVAVQDCCKVDLCSLYQCHTWRNNPTNCSKETNHRSLEKIVKFKTYKLTRKHMKPFCV